MSNEFLLNFNLTAQRDDGHAQCHPEFSSGSVRGEEQEKARSEMLKQVNFVQFAHARHNQASLTLLSLNRKFQHDIWSHLLFLLSFW